MSHEEVTPLRLVPDFSVPDPIPPGLYHFTRLAGDSPTRFHLRVDPDGAGLLLANAAEAAHLSPVGVRMVWGALSQLGDAAIVAQVRAGFRGATAAEIHDDLWHVHRLLADLSTPDAEYPVRSFAGFEAAGAGRRLAAPFRAEVVPGPLSAMQPVLAALWEAGIPHVTFLDRPACDPGDLVRLVERAGDLGMITGIRTVASWLPPEALRRAALAGLDHLTLVFAACDPGAHDALVDHTDHAAVREAIALCHELELCPVGQVPLTAHSTPELADTAACLLAQGVRDTSFFAIACLDAEAEAAAAGALPARALPQVATMVTECAERVGARFTWEPPVRFDRRRSLAQHVLAGPRASGDIAVRVEPDGAVLPARGPRTCAGNLLAQPWPTIWHSDCFVHYREGLAPARRCEVCPDLALCAAACPRDPAGWSDDTEEGQA